MSEESIIDEVKDGAKGLEEKVVAEIKTDWEVIAKGLAQERDAIAVRLNRYGFVLEGIDRFLKTLG